MRHLLLAFLCDAQAHGYELKQAIEQTFGDAWPPINIGQIYTTLSRLERDGLVQSAHVSQDGRPDKRVYGLTDAGRHELHAWLEAPVSEPRLKDEFLSKLIVATRLGLNGALKPLDLIARQRRAYLQNLRDLNELASRQQAGSDGAALLLIEGAILHLQADLKWLELCEQRLLTTGGVH
jgi:DNA-binding PadR family transcriptional regulator